MKEHFECDNCSKQFTEDQCNEAKDILMRMERGSIFTDLECPECGALCYSVGEKAEPDEPMNPQRWDSMTPVEREDFVDESKLDERFTPYYLSGERVEVIEEDGRKKRFYVGKSTGWKPIYLEIKRKDSSGGEGILSSWVTSIRGVGVYQDAPYRRRTR